MLSGIGHLGTDLDPLFPLTLSSSEYDDLGLARVLLRKFGDASCADGNPDL